MNQRVGRERRADSTSSLGRLTILTIAQTSRTNGTAVLAMPQRSGARVIGAWP